MHWIPRCISKILSAFVHIMFCCSRNLHFTLHISKMAWSKINSKFGTSILADMVYIKFLPSGKWCLGTVQQRQHPSMGTRSLPHHFAFKARKFLGLFRYLVNITAGGRWKQCNGDMLQSCTYRVFGPTD